MSTKSNVKTTPEQNKHLVLEAFDTLFNKRDYAAAQKLWSPHYVQHSAHIEPGRDGLFNLVKTLPPTLRYEPGTIVGDGNFVIAHGRYSGFQPVNWIVADIFRIEDGLLVEHWDVIQNEATEAQSRSKAPMFEPQLSEMTLRIEQSSDRGHTTIRLIGRMQVDHVAEVQKQIEASGPTVTLDLEEVTLVDVQAVRFLGACATRGIVLRNGSPYINDWIASERH